MKSTVIVILALMAIIMIIFSLKYPNRKRYFWFYVLSGWLTYALCLIVGCFSDAAKLEFNLFNIGVSATGGIPGVAFLYFLKYLL